MEGPWHYSCYSSVVFKATVQQWLFQSQPERSWLLSAPPFSFSFSVRSAATQYYSKCLWPVWLPQCASPCNRQSHVRRHSDVGVNRKGDGSLLGLTCNVPSAAQTCRYCCLAPLWISYKCILECLIPHPPRCPTVFTSVFSCFFIVVNQQNEFRISSCSFCWGRSRFRSTAPHWATSRILQLWFSVFF